MGDFIPLQDILDVLSCSARGEKLRGPAKGDAEHEDLMIRREGDVNSHPGTIGAGAVKVRPFPSPIVGGLAPLCEGQEGLTGETVRGNGMTTLVPRVDASKATDRHEPRSYQNPHHRYIENGPERQISRLSKNSGVARRASVAQGLVKARHRARGRPPRAEAALRARHRGCRS
jgi:hypothetical protein